MTLGGAISKNSEKLSQWVCKIRRYLGKTGDWEVEAGVSLGKLEEMEDIYQRTNLIANSQLLNLF